jgi:hypothetical protein
MFKNYIALLAVAQAFETDETATWDAAYSTMACGKCIRSGFYYCTTGKTIAPHEYSPAAGESAPNGECVETTAAAGALHTTAGSHWCSDQFSSPYYAISQLCPSNTDPFGANTITNVTATPTKSFQDLPEGEVCSYRVIFNDKWCSSPWVAPLEEENLGVAPNTGFVYTVEWNSADTGMSMDSVSTSWPDKD